MFVSFRFGYPKRNETNIFSSIFFVSFRFVYFFSFRFVSDIRNETKRNETKNLSRFPLRISEFRNKRLSRLKSLEIKTNIEFIFQVSAIKSRNTDICSLLFAEEPRTCLNLSIKRSIKLIDFWSLDTG